MLDSRHPANAAKPATRGASFLMCLFVGLLACGVTCRAGTVADLDRDDGLPDAKLGTSIKAFQGLERTEDVGRWTSFRRPGDRLVFEGYKVTAITYNFFKDELYSIDIDVDGGHNVKGVLDKLEKNYGKQHTFDTRSYPKTDGVMEVREWTGTKAYCVYKSAADSRGAVLVFVDKPRWDLLQVPKQEREAQSRGMLKGSYSNGDF